MKKAQIKLMETVGVILIFFVLLFFGFIFYVQFQKGALQQKQAEMQADDAVDVALLVMSLSEISCSERNIKEDDCVDLSKIDAASFVMGENIEYYYDLFGFANITIMQVYPQVQKWNIYNNAGDYNRKISTPIPVVLKDPVKNSYSYGVIIVDSFS